MHRFVVFFQIDVFCMIVLNSLKFYAFSVDKLSTFYYRKKLKPLTDKQIDF